MQKRYTMREIEKERQREIQNDFKRNFVGGFTHTNREGCLVVHQGWNFSWAQRLNVSFQSI